MGILAMAMLLSHHGRLQRCCVWHRSTSRLFTVRDTIMLAYDFLLRCIVPGDRLSYFLLLNEIAPCLRHFCQCLGDVVGGHALGFEIQDHAFFIVPPKDAINEIIPTRPQDMDRAHGALLPSAQGSIFLSCFAGIVSRNIPCL